MRLRAVSIDRELRDNLRGGGFRGAVLSAHRDAAYLELSGGSLIALVREEIGNGPGFVLLPGVASFSEGPAGVIPSAPFNTEGGLIGIGGGMIVIETEKAAAWDSSLRLRAVHPVVDIRRCALAALAHTAARRHELGLGLLAGRISEIADGKPATARSGECAFVEERVRDLASALARDEGAAEAARAVVGLGDGLTPSCDDMLVGLAGVLQGISADPRRGAWARGCLGALNGAIEGAAGRTTPVSRHFLRSAARGCFAERVKNLIEAVLGANEKMVAAAKERVLEYGATSGVDLIFGIALGILIMSRREKEAV